MSVRTRFVVGLREWFEHALWLACASNRSTTSFKMTELERFLPQTIFEANSQTFAKSKKEVMECQILAAALEKIQKEFSIDWGLTQHTECPVCKEDLILNYVYHIDDLNLEGVATICWPHGTSHLVKKHNVVLPVFFRKAIAHHSRKTAAQDN